MLFYSFCFVSFTTLLPHHWLTHISIQGSCGSSSTALSVAIILFYSFCSLTSVYIQVIYLFILSCGAIFLPFFCCISCYDPLLLSHTPLVSISTRSFYTLCSIRMSREKAIVPVISFSHRMQIHVLVCFGCAFSFSPLCASPQCASVLLGYPYFLQCCYSFPFSLLLSPVSLAH